MINENDLNDLKIRAEKYFREYISMNEVQEEYAVFFENYSEDALNFLIEYLDVRHDLQLNVESIILRASLFLNSNYDLPIGRYDVHFDNDLLMIDEIFDLFELTVNPPTQYSNN